jgi:hypothetical protein
MVTSSLSSFFIYMSTTEGNFYVFDTRGNGQISQKDKLHTDVMIDFSLTKDENFAVTCSLDRTINLVKIIRL